MESRTISPLVELKIHSVTLGSTLKLPRITSGLLIPVTSVVELGVITSSPDKYTVGRVVTKITEVALGSDNVSPRLTVGLFISVINVDDVGVIVRLPYITYGLIE
jgi:hypothetical protein